MSFKFSELTLHRVLPWMCLAYLIQAMDKDTLNRASIMGWQKDVGAKGQDYALTSTFLWIGIIVGEPLVSFTGQILTIELHLTVSSDHSDQSIRASLPRGKSAWFFDACLECRE